MTRTQDAVATAATATTTTSKPDAVIFDMDGTLCDVSSIRHHIVNPSRPSAERDGLKTPGSAGSSRHKDFDAFHREAVNCPPHPKVVSSAQFLDMIGLKIIIVTARSARYRNSTAFWLAIHDVPSDAMYMRADGDYRPDVEVKREILAKIRQRYRVRHAYDDNPSILALWESEDIPTTRIPGWNHNYE